MAISFTKPGAGTAGTAAPTVAPAAAAPAFTSVSPGPAVDAVAPASAASSPQRAQAGVLLVQLFRYLEQHLDGHPALTPAIAALRDALAEYRRGGGDPFSGVRSVVAVVQSVRASDSALPEP